MPGGTTPPIADQPPEDVPVRQEKDDDDDASNNSYVMYPSCGELQRMIDSPLKKYEKYIFSHLIDIVIEERVTALLKNADHLAAKGIHNHVYSAVEKIRQLSSTPRSSR